jgi:hypothetical protein
MDVPGSKAPLKVPGQFSGQSRRIAANLGNRQKLDQGTTAVAFGIVPLPKANQSG